MTCAKTTSPRSWLAPSREGRTLSGCPTSCSLICRRSGGSSTRNGCPAGVSATSARLEFRSGPPCWPTSWPPRSRLPKQRRCCASAPPGSPTRPSRYPYSARRSAVNFGTPHVTTFVPVRPLPLVRLYSDDAAWLLRHGASHSLMHGPRATGRNWARAIAEVDRVDGLWVQSTMTGRATTVLFASSASKLPDEPRDSAPLSAPLSHGRGG